MTEIRHGENFNSCKCKVTKGYWEVKRKQKLQLAEELKKTTEAAGEADLTEKVVFNKLDGNWLEVI